MKKKNGFTLIELLAIIVILAIIAVITVPIILGIIDDAKKGTVEDSAYGYKEAVNKWYVQKLLDNQDLKLNGVYTVTDGVLDGENVDNDQIPISGSIPKSGYLTYEDDDLINGCLVINGYEAIYQNGKFTSNGKGDCGGVTPSIPTIPSCPGCKFIYILDNYAIVGSSAEAYYSSDMPTEDNGLTNDYTTLIGEGGHPYFLGLIESTSDSTKIGRAFACGIENDTPFCLEGYDPSKYSDDDNVGILNTIFPECGASASRSSADCYGSSGFARAYNSGSVDVVDDNGSCYVNYDGNVGCDE